MTQPKPTATGTSHTLPFDKLSPRDFERLCLWLVEREGYERAEHLGAAGSEQGRDIIAWREGELWAFQCKRVQNFYPKDALGEVDKVLSLRGDQRPVGMVFLVTCDVSANARQQARECAHENEIACHFWTGTELDAKVKRHPDIVEEFFQAAERNIVWFDTIKKLPGWIKGFIALVTALVGFILLWQNYPGLVLPVVLATSVSGGTLGFAYLAFKRAPPRVEGSTKGPWQYPRWRPWALIGLVIIVPMTAGGVGYYFYQQGQPPDKVIILIADFEGPDPKGYRVTETVVARLRQEMEKYDDVEIECLGKAITEAEGSAVARAEGEAHKAAIVIWGWYGATAEVVPLTVHFEVLRHEEYMPDFGLEVKGQVQTVPLADIESFALQTKLSEEMACLSLFTAGVAQYAAEDWDRAIALFSDALSLTIEYVPALNQGIIYFYRGTALSAKENWDKSIADFDQALEYLESRPDLSSTYYNRGIIRYQQGDVEGAIADFSEAIELDPDSFQAYSNRGIIRREQGDFESAIADHTRAIEINPDAAKLYNNRGNARSDQGDATGAIADFSKAIELDPSFADAYYNRGIARKTQSDLEGAIADYTKAIEINSDYAEAYSNRGYARYQQGDVEGAIADFNRAIEINPNHALAYYDRGSARQAQGDLEGAIADFNKAIEIDPHYDEAYTNRGGARYAQGDVEGAIADFSRAIEIDPNDAEPCNNRGVVRRNQGDLEGAIADFNKAIEIDPNYADAYCNRGKLLADYGDLDGAIADYNEAIGIDPDNVEAYSSRAIAFAQQGDLERAIADFTMCVEIDPDDADNYYNRGTARVFDHDLEGAIDDFTKAIKAYPGFFKAYLNRGVARGQQGDLEGAVADFTKAKEIDPDDASPYNSLCWWYALDGQPERAMPFCQQAIELDPRPAFKDSRGLAYALLGDYPSAIDDFEAYATWLEQQPGNGWQDDLVRRRTWIEALRDGQNPFTSEVLDELRTE